MDIFCDSATNSKLAELKSFLFNHKNSNAIINFYSNEFIHFPFIPPRTPLFSGLWGTLSNSRGLYPTYEELSTAMVAIEGILNSSDPNDFEALTPGYFLIGAPLRSLPERDVLSKEVDKLEYWARISAAKYNFWKKWSNDYLNELQTHNKLTASKPNIKPGSLVIVREDNLPPQQWFIKNH